MIHWLSEDWKQDLASKLESLPMNSQQMMMTQDHPQYWQLWQQQHQWACDDVADDTLFPVS
jgi:hypothetical protein